MEDLVSRYPTSLIHEEEDDLDRYKVIDFVLDDTVTISIRQYAAHPQESVSLYLTHGDTAKGIDEVSALTERVVEELGLSPEAVVWQRRDAFSFSS